MLSLLGALWFSIVTSGVIDHRLYFRPSELSTDSNRQVRHMANPHPLNSHRRVGNNQRVISKNGSF